MINDLRFAFKCIRYASNKLSMFIVTILCCFVAILSLIFTKSLDNILLSIYLITSFPLYTVHMYQSLNASTLIESSTLKKKMQTKIPAVVSLFSTIVGYAIVGIIITIMYKVGRFSYDMLGFLFLLDGIMALFILIYLSIAYKHLVLTNIVFFVLIIVFFDKATEILTDPPFALPLWCGICSGIVCIIIGSCAFYGLSILQYKVPMDRFVLSSGMKQEL